MIVERSKFETRAIQEQEEMMVISLSIKELENKFHQEEENYVKNLHRIFGQAWNGVSLGETFLCQTISLFKGESQSVSKEIFPIVHMQIR